jgi:3-oxoacyl-[acyl-carrier protein] reductase
VRIAIEDSASIAAAAAAVEERYGHLDALVNSGGATTPVPLNDLAALTDEIFDRTVRINLRGPFAMVRAFRPLLERGSGAAVVNISSIAARTGQGSSIAYLSAKGGVDSLTVALAKVLAPRIRVFSVSPAGVDTDFVPGRSREALQKMADNQPLAHLTTPDDVARAVIACIVNLTSTTGIVLPVDEGRHL